MDQKFVKKTLGLSMVERSNLKDILLENRQNRNLQIIKMGWHFACLQTPENISKK